MSRRRPAPFFRPRLELLAVLLLAAGCAAPGEHPRAKAEVPGEFSVSLTLEKGQSWSSRFVSTSDLKRTFRGGDGKETVRELSSGIELTAVQTVESVEKEKAIIEVRETKVRILRDGKYVDAPFRQFDPPNPVSFTLNLETGETDFAGMEKAYAEWMGRVKEGPAGEIIGKTFRVDDYVAQIKDIYAKPFTRFAGRKLARAPGAAVAREFVRPFLGPGTAIAPIPAEASAWYVSMDVRGGTHSLNTAGKYEGKAALSPEELKDRLADFPGAPAASAAAKSSVSVTGAFKASVDVLSGREIRSTNTFDYAAEAAVDGGTLTETIRGKSVLEPAE